MSCTTKIYHVTLKNNFVPSMQPRIFLAKTHFKSSVHFMLVTSKLRIFYDSIVSPYLNIDSLK